VVVVVSSVTVRVGLVVVSGTVGTTSVVVGSGVVSGSVAGGVVASGLVRGRVGSVGTTVPAGRVAVTSVRVVRALPPPPPHAPRREPPTAASARRHSARAPL